MKTKTSELTDAALDWVVATCEGHSPEYHRNYTVAEELAGIRRYTISVETLYDNEGRDFQPKYSPSTNWSQGGPIIEREMLAPEPLLDTNCALIKWRCRNWKGDGSDFYGPTPLIAAMRCFVASKLGDEVDVPEELR